MFSRKQLARALGLSGVSPLGGMALGVLVYCSFCNIILANPMSLLGKGDRRIQGRIEYQSDVSDFTVAEVPQSAESDERSFKRNGVSLAAPLWTSDFSMFGASLGFERTDLGIDSFHVGRNQNVTVAGRKLTRTAVGASFQEAQYDDSSWGLNLSVGQASDRVEWNGDSLTLSANLTWGFAPSELDQWVIILNYDNNRNFLVGLPLPSFAYVSTLSRRATWIIGVPFVMYRYIDFPKRFFIFSLNPGGVFYKLAVGVFGPFQVVNEFQFGVQNFLHSERQDRDDRLFVETKTASIGLDAPVSRAVRMEFRVAYGFDRRVYESQGLFDPEGEKLSLPQAWLYRLAIDIKI